MKKTTKVLLAGLFSLATAATATAQDAKEIVKKHNDAIGGTANWSKITSMKKEGKANMNGSEIDMVIAVLKGKGLKQDLVIGGVSNYFIITPTGGWSFMPIQGQTKPQQMPQEQIKEAAEHLDFQDKLMEADAKKYAIELAGKEDIDGKPAFKLKVTDAEKGEHIYFIDAATWYLVRSVEKADAMGQTMEVVSNFSNHTKLPEGIVVPMKEEAGMSGSLTLSKVEVNTIKDESYFKVPQ
ncbi:LolA-like protein [Taibaiella koreensis]|uniref:hypothetical protein n=1 Tax=Taibaiella koreensis TaxID=1268548 RepID=UPI000E59BD4F|nr:hypothetical protein [Taibaiella koreensis]